MYTKEEAASIKKEFWTAFGQYMSLHPSAEGIKVNWINYRTGIKDIIFRTDVISRQTYIGIELHHQDEGIRELFFEQFLELRTYLHSIMGEEWIWQESYTNPDNGKTISRIFADRHGFTLFNRDHWPDIISFLKPRLIKLDEFWGDAKYSFDALK